MFFGGLNSFSVVVLDTASQKVVHGPLKTAINTIDSLTVCRIGPGTADAKAVLVVAGRKIDYSNGNTDMFDVTGLVQRHSTLDLQRRNARLASCEQAKLLQAKIDVLEQRLRQQSSEHERLMNAKDRHIAKLDDENDSLKRALEIANRRHAQEKSKFESKRPQQPGCATMDKPSATRNVIERPGTGSPSQDDFHRESDKPEELEVRLSQKFRETGGECDDAPLLIRPIRDCIDIDIRKLRAQLTIIEACNQQLERENISLQRDVQTLTNLVNHRMTTTNPCFDWYFAAKSLFVIF